MRRLDSAAKTFDAGGHPELLRFRRTESCLVRTGDEEVHVRDQKPLHRGCMELDRGWSFECFVQKLNELVFFWPGTEDGRPISYGRRHFERYQCGFSPLRERETKPARGTDLQDGGRFPARAFAGGRDGLPRFRDPARRLGTRFCARRTVEAALSVMTPSLRHDTKTTSRPAIPHRDWPPGGRVGGRAARRPGASTGRAAPRAAGPRRDSRGWKAPET